VVDPSVLDWLTAIGTAGAAVIPVGFYLVERRDRKRAEQRALDAEGAARRQLERQQADLVSCWMDPLPVHDEYRFHLLNVSAMPVTAVSLRVVAVVEDAPTSSTDSSWSREQKGSLGLDILPPTGHEARVVALSGLERFGGVTESSLRDVTFLDLHFQGLAFRDAAGREWWRDRDGRLERADDG